MEKVILTPEELQNLKQISDNLNAVTINLGTMEVQIHDLNSTKTQLLQELTKIKQSQEVLGKTLNAKYGTGTVDLESGEFVQS